MPVLYLFLLGNLEQKLHVFPITGLFQGWKGNQKEYLESQMCSSLAGCILICKTLSILFMRVTTNFVRHLLPCNKVEKLQFHSIYTRLLQPCIMTNLGSFIYMKSIHRE